MKSTADRIDSVLILVLAAAAVLACDQDPFGVNDRWIGGDYELYRFPENDKFYLDDRSLDHPGGGVLEGTIERIGWDDRTIVAWRHPMFGGNPAGWMVVDIDTKAISGPLAGVTRDAEQVNGIPVRDVLDAWNDLR